MRTRYQVKFGERLSAQTSLNSYEYLNILDRAWGRAWLDVCAQRRALRLGLFAAGHARIDYAARLMQRGILGASGGADGAETIFVSGIIFLYSVNGS